MANRNIRPDQSMARLEEKFMRLLEADRNSKEFERLYWDVDAELEKAIEKADLGGITRAS